MSVTNRQSGTNVYEVSDGIYRINTPVTIPGTAGFSFNQYLIVDDEPVLFHTRWALSYLRGPLTRAPLRRARSRGRRAAISGCVWPCPRLKREPGNGKPRQIRKPAMPAGRTAWGF